jgi:hypothetical protein
MHIEIARAPNILGTYRYDVRAAGRVTHGFRTTQGAARDAAQEDGGFMYLCGRSEQADTNEALEQKALPRRLREKPGRV